MNRKRELLLSTVLLVMAAQVARADETIETVTVTAEKRSADIQSVGIAITTISGQDMKTEGDTGLDDILISQPSVQIAKSDGGGQIYIRGLGTEEGFEPDVDFNVDGVYEAFGAQDLLSFYDINRVEVLRGPQATLYGRNASSGVINVISNDPDPDTTQGGLTVDIGNYNEIKPEAFVNLPITDDMAIRVAAGAEYHTGYLNDGYDNADSYSVRGKFLWQATKRLRVLISGTFSKDLGITQGATLPLGTTNWLAAQPYNPPFLGTGGLTAGNGATPSIGSNPWTAPVSYPASNRTKIFAYHAQIDYDLDFATLTLLPAYVGFSQHSLAPAAGVLNQYDTTSDQTSVEARLTSRSDQTLTWLVGFYYFGDIQAESNAFRGDFYPNVLVPVPACIPSGTLTHCYEEYTSDPSVDHWTSYAGFADATYKFTDTVRVTVGLRYTQDDKTSIETPDDFNLVEAPFTIGSPTENLGTFPGGALNLAHDWSALNWHVETDWDVTPASMLYAKADTAYKPGGFFPNVPPDDTYKPENLLAFEVGSKNTFLNGALRLNGDFYFYDYRDKQLATAGFFLSVLGPVPVTVVDNAGPANIYGAELDGTYLLTGDDRLDFSGSWEHTKMGVWKGAGYDYSGFPLPYVPNWSTNLNYDHTFRLADGATIMPSVHFHWESGSWKSVQHLPYTYQTPWTRTDLMLSYATLDSALTITAYVKNLENKPIMTENEALSDTELLLAPRTFGVVLSTQF